MFQLHERLQADTAPVAELPLCRVLLMDNRVWPWLILVPAIPGLTEIHQLDEARRHRLVDEIAQASTALEDLVRPDKINVGALGNMVPQLHVHVIARTRSDPAWPGPVWGSGFAERYDPAERDSLIRSIGERLGQK
ncbi:HIT domain-containing protein [Azospirillum canadense]|uniref:HIT domain-containing protein n=1 Tax=Azospirillum canadense TaxID=403962 RepID=UPI002228066F|nr:HIT family protein [Azospirillum canadense]MCW2237268.1 diadenosine tetraphosphate (Ap4A) HIT family hydrolase [Azospirillum canadense]